MKQFGYFGVLRTCSGSIERKAFHKRHMIFNHTINDMFHLFCEKIGTNTDHLIIFFLLILDFRNVNIIEMYIILNTFEFKSHTYLYDL